MKLIIGILIFTFLVLLGYGFDKYGKTNKEASMEEIEETPTETENTEEKEE